MEAGTDGAKNVAAVELRGGEKIERGGKKTDPGSAANRREKEHVGINPRVKKCVETP